MSASDKPLKMVTCSGCEAKVFIPGDLPPLSTEPCKRCGYPIMMPMQLRQFELRSKIASGGHGKVYRAFDTVLERLVAERTVIAPGMSFIASSIGRVTVAIISSAGMMPLFTMITTRGKFVCGNTEDGVRKAEKTPARHSAAAINVMDNACRVANRAKGEMASGFIWRQLNWLPTFRCPENLGR